MAIQGFTAYLTEAVALGSALSDPHPKVRKHAAWALGKVGGGSSWLEEQGGVPR